MKKVGVLSLRQIHHSLHVAPIAFELSMRPGYEVTLYTSYQVAADFLRELSSYYPDHNCRIAVLDPPWWQFVFNVKRRVYPRPSSVLKHNADELLALDAIISSDYYSLRLLDLRVGSRPFFIKTPHGAGTRAYGFKDTLGRYDLLLGPGAYFRNRLCQMGVLEHVDLKLVGHPKFDIIDRIHQKPTKLFDNDHPVVVYNPHFQGDLSSWPKWGKQVLDFFSHNSQFNLIFAPHINLFARKRTDPRLSEKHFHAANILIDLGSSASVDMTYTYNADLYLGDVSSQVQEFIHRPRPCIFLNSHGVDWRNNINYECWNLGRVLNSLDELGDALRDAFAGNDPYRGVQLETFRHVFADGNEPASVRSANAITELLEAAEEDRKFSE